MHNGNGVHRNGSRDRACTVSSKDELAAVLRGAGIQLARWRIEDFETLWKEVETGHTTFVLRYDSILVCRAYHVRALIQFTCASRGRARRTRDVYTLVEGANVSLRSARRALPYTSYSLGIHLYPEEQSYPVQTLLKRLLQGTLGIRGIPALIRLSRTDIEAGASFPGLIKETAFRLYMVELDKKQFVQDGYISADISALRRFVWQRRLSGVPLGNIENKGHVRRPSSVRFRSRQ